MSTPTSSQPQRGRKVAAKGRSNTRSMQIFYAVIGLVVIAGLAFLFNYAGSDGNNSAESAAAPDTEDASENGIPTAPASDAAPDAEIQEGTVAGGFYTRGNPDAAVTVIEYSDFQCPACANFSTSSLYTQLQEEYIEPGKIQFIFHDFPLPYHDNAPKASEAARCAGEQDPAKYWQMHDLLFERQNEWISGSPENRFNQFAATIELDGEQFQSCLSNGKYSTEVNAAFQAAMDAEIPATPTFVVNGEQVKASLLLTKIDAALQQAGG